MNKKTEKPIALRIAYIGGGSRGWAHSLIKDLLQCDTFTGEVRLYDIDREMAQLNARFGNWLQGHPKAVSKWKYRAVASLKTCLKDADMVFCSTLPGPIESMKVDLQEPQKYGIYQAVGDTVGPGGAMRALRAARDYKVIAQAIAQYAPDAWVLNFTNPMTVCTQTLYTVFPGIKAYGCCHEVFGTQRLLGEIYSKMTGDSVPTREEIKVNVMGINHFTWIDKATCRGVDLMQLLQEYVTRPRVIRKYTQKNVKGYFQSYKQVSFELYRRFGILAAAGDRHLAEFVPWFLTDRDSCYRWGFALTPYAYRSSKYYDSPRRFKKILASGEYPELNTSGEEYLNQMEALTGRQAMTTNVNLPNRGQIKNLPRGAVVETNARFAKDSVKPVRSGSLPDNVAALIQPHIANQKSLIEAVLTGDKDLAFQAFLNDPLVNISMDDAWKLFNAMLKKTHFNFDA